MCSFSKKGSFISIVLLIVFVILALTAVVLFTTAGVEKKLFGTLGIGALCCLVLALVSLVSSFLVLDCA